MADLTAPVVLKDAAKRFVLGPVLIPGEPDSDGDVVTIEQIERVAHTFAEKYQNIDLQHTLQNVGKVLETYIAPVDLEFGELFIPKGSWIMGVRVTDDATWEAVQKGHLTGFSIMGIPAALKSKEGTVEKSQRTTLADLGDNWVVNAVSLVDEPAVPKAKWVVIKSKQSSIKSIAGSYEHRREQLDKALNDLFHYEDRPYIYQMFDTHVVLVHWGMDGDQYLDVPYTYEDGTVTFGEPVAIQVEEIMVRPEPTPEVVKETLWQKAMKALGFHKDQAIKSEKGVLDMNKEELEALVAESVAKALAAQKSAEEAPQEPVVEPDQEPVEPTVEPEPEVDPEPTPEAPEEPVVEEVQPEQEDNSQEVIKSLMERIEALEKSRSSKRLFGQDNTGVAQKSAAKSDRDAFGRKIN